MKLFLVGSLLVVCAAINAAPSPTFTGPFTISYEMVRKDVRSKAVQEEDLDSIRASYGSYIQAGKMRPAQVDDILTAIRAQMAKGDTTARRVTFSYDGKTLCYRELDTGGIVGGKEFSNVLLSKTGQFYQAPGMIAILQPNVSQAGLIYAPLVGADLPYLPATQDGKILSLSTVDKVLAYLPGKVTTTPTSMTASVSMKGKLVEQWHLTDFTAVSGGRIAKHIKFVTYHYGGRKDSDGKPKEETDYDLVEANSTALPVSTFAMTSYIHDKDSVQVTRADGKTRILRYEAKVASLDKQFDQLLGYERVMDMRSRRSGGAAAVTGLATALFILGFGFRIARSQTKP